MPGNFIHISPKKSAHIYERFFFSLFFQIYLAECADSEFRGITINAGYVSLSAGFLLTFALGAIMDWRYLAWSGIVFPIITLVGLSFLPETPVWLIRNGHIDQAYKNLYWLRGDAKIARTELKEYLTRFDKEKQNEKESTQNAHSFADFLRPSILKPITIIFSFILLFNMTGTYLIIYYAIDILSQVDLEMGAQNVSVCLSAIRLIVTVGFCWLFMRVKRRKIYLIAGIGSTFSTLTLAAYLFNKPTLFPDKSIISSCIAGSLLIIYVATNTGFMIAPGFLIGELLPAKIRGRLAGAIYTYFGVITFFLTKFFPHSNAYIGFTGVVLVFCLASLATTALIYFMVPETKGKSLLEIEQYFQTHGWIYQADEVKSSVSSQS